MMTDSELKTVLMERFDAIPSIDATDIEVHVHDGMVTLSGEVDTQQTRFQVERAARKVPGVRGLHVRIQSSTKSNGSGYR
jgi:osmotically-inducible protein OsmY